MKLIDLLEVIEDSQFVIVSDSNNDEIARYDGRDSIDKKYNNKKVIALYANPGMIHNTSIAWIRIQINV